MSFVLPPADPSDPRYAKRGALYVPSGQGPTIWAASDVYTVKATATQTNGAFGFVDASVPPGSGPEAHAHNEGDETFYMLSGELEFLDGDRTFTASAGDFIYVPAGIRHRFKNKGVHPAKVIFFFTPGGQEEAALDLADRARPGELPPALGPQDVERYLELARRNKTDLLPDLA